MVEFREVYKCKLTTATTCYSAPSQVSNDRWTANLATERHLLEIKLKLGGIRKDSSGSSSSSSNHSQAGKGGHTQASETGPIDTTSVSCAQYSIPTPEGIPRRIAKKLICVGYSQCPESGWEAMVLLDTTKSSQQDSTEGGGVGDLHDDDDRTTATTTTAESSRPSGYRRSSSSGNTSVASSDGGASVASSSAASTSSAPAVNSGGGEGGARISGLNKLSNLEEEGGNEEEEEGYSRPVSRLVLLHRGKQLHYSKALDVRPLSPCVGIIGHESDNNKEVVGVWIGSADDTKLRLFRADDALGALLEVPIEEKWQSDTDSPVSFLSPVMAIDCLSLPKTDMPSNPVDDDDTTEENNKQLLEYNSLLAVACQDGTIRFIGYSCTAQSDLQCREEYTVTVDGPILSVYLSLKKDTGKVEAVIGSLCGYVARFLKRTHGIDESSTARLNAHWEGPYMVAEGFGTGSQGQEDSVLAVHSWGDKVAIGTYSGRCLIYGQTTSADETGDYGLPFLDCQLPESIHGICHIPTETCIILLVTTRKSIHVFQEIPKVYNPVVARKILESLLSQQRPKATPPSTTSAEEKEEYVEPPSEPHTAS